MSEPYRVLATCGIFEPGFRGGGPIRSVARIVDTVSSDVECTLVTSDRDLGDDEPYQGLSGGWVQRNDATRVFYRNRRDPRHWLTLARELRKIRFDLLYVNSFWAPFDTLLPLVALRLRLLRADAVLLAPRGELSRGAMELKSWKKSLVLRFWAPMLRRMNVVWHACAAREATEIRAVCPWANIMVNGDMVSLPEQPLTAVVPGPTARLVFLGRISPMKNLRLILEALATLPFPVSLDIFGPIEDTGYWEECGELLEHLPSVRYRGFLMPELVPTTLAKYDALVFPTRGENFGHVIAESLYASCPVICSDQTPWNTVLHAGGGVVLPALTRERLAEAIHKWTRMTLEERLHAKRSAGLAYQQWRRHNATGNVIDQFRSAQAKRVDRAEQQQSDENPHDRRHSVGSQHGQTK